jgi:hypothetical protein
MTRGRWRHINNNNNLLTKHQMILTAGLHVSHKLWATTGGWLHVIADIISSWLLMIIVIS